MCPSCGGAEDLPLSSLDSGVARAIVYEFARLMSSPKQRQELSPPRNDLVRCPVDTVNSHSLLSSNLNLNIDFSDTLVILP